MLVHTSVWIGKQAQVICEYLNTYQFYIGHKFNGAYVLFVSQKIMFEICGTHLHIFHGRPMLLLFHSVH